ncbi:MAG: NPCBM/NEW2 domain-containing protein [Candidatus Symbiothrix sp.]|jgi:alpha-galactosidase|nr:NPCBM/NEW2 domain-containing protein [Candidatus Symbiothrix sp.]
MYRLVFIVLLTLVTGQETTAKDKVILLDGLDLNKCVQPTGRPGQIGENGNLKISGRHFANGIHSRTESVLYIELDSETSAFSAEVGVDDRSTAHRRDTVKKEESTAEFFVIGDGKTLWQSGLMKYKDAPKHFTVKLDGVKSLILKSVGQPGASHIDWVNAFFTYSGKTPKTVWSPEIQKTISETLEFVSEQNKKYPKPRINGAMKVGIRPNTPFNYPVAVTGMSPMNVHADGLPEGLSLDTQTGVIAGTPVKAGDYAVRLTAANDYGTTERILTIAVGESLSLTPPMGYLSWNVVEGLISEIFLKETTDAFVDFGLRDVGYQYINMDDCWQGKRGVDGYITPDIHRFPNGLKTVGDYLHQKGFKFGIYSSPNSYTCAGYQGTLDFEKQDVESWASWGVDYLKHDYCWCPAERADELFTKMGELLKSSGRSIVYCIGMGDGEKSNEYGCHVWRTGGDIRDIWSVDQGGLPGSVGIVESFEKAQQTAGLQRPGGWNDPDMLLTGIYGRGDSSSDLTDERGCTDTEYRSQVSLWALMSAPMFISVDVRQINKATLETLTNPEVIDINQDALGIYPKRIGNAGEQEVWVKQMADGSKTVALFNKASTPVKMAVRWTDIGIKGRHPVRDLWQRKDMGTFGKEYTDTVSPHGVTLIRIFNK